MQIDFYVMEDANRMAALRELCLLLEAPYAQQQPIYIHTASAADADQIDKLLWTYRDDSFLAHQISGASDSAAPIEIGVAENTPRTTEILVNLSNQIPAFYQQFKRVIEIVFADPAVQQNARDRFRQYREHGCELNTHKMKVKPT